MKTGVIPPFFRKSAAKRDVLKQLTPLTRRDSALTRGNAALHAQQGLTRRALRPALPLFA